MQGCPVVVEVEGLSHMQGCPVVVEVEGGQAEVEAGLVAVEGMME